MRTLMNVVMVIALVVITFVITKAFFLRKETVVETETVIDTIRDTTKIVKTLPAPEPDTVIQYSMDTVKLPPDTIIKREYITLYRKFHQTNIYNRTLQDDSSALVRLIDTVSENRLRGCNYSFINRRPTKVIKKQEIYNQRKFFVGVDFGINTVQPAVVYKSLNDIQYKVGYNFGQNKGLRFGVYTSFSNFYW